MSRNSSFFMRIMEAFAARLKDHWTANPELWNEIPTEVKVGMSVAWDTTSLPMIGLTVESVEDIVSGTNLDIGRMEVKLKAYCFSMNPDDPEGASLQLASDVRRAVAIPVEGRQLGGVLATGLIFYDGVEFAVDPEGAALAVCSFRCQCQWEEATA